MARGTLSLVFCGLVVLQAAFAVAALSEKQRVSSVSVEGVVFCDQCLQEKITKSSNVLKGAKVAIMCEGMRNEGKKASMVATTDGEGRFKADLSDKLFDEEGNIKCVATLKASPRVSCRLASRTAGISSTEFSRSAPAAAASHITYSVGDLSFRPSAVNPLCAQASYYEPKLPPIPDFKPPKEEPKFKFPKEEPPKEEPKFKFPKEEPPKEEPKFDFPKFSFPKFKFPKDKYPKYPPTP